MAFLFKSKKSQERALSSRDGNSHSGSQGSIQSAGARMPRDDHKHAVQRATPTGSFASADNIGTGSPEQIRRGGSLEQMQPADLTQHRNGSITSNPNASLYPWSQRRLTYTSPSPTPFPRYGAAVNAVASKEGDIYMMGGLINSSTVKGDLWLVEAGGNLACYPLATTAEGPGPRVGHASLLVGNAFIVYGGDTKIEEADELDETLYLLNTSTRHWSRALPAGTRPSGRYGHTLNILGSKIYIFGGQVEGLFMNDLSAFDLNQLQSPNYMWEILLNNDPSPNAPPARTNHTVITYNDKLYLFGGTNGVEWFNDVWCYDPAVNSWSQLDCIGYIPPSREGHAAAVVDDVMYVFGGRTEEGTDLGDLAAFRISSRRWYTFQNMGPSPSPRSGHSMTTVGKSVVVLGGEPSSATTSIHDLGIMYVLDTTKIRYPNDGPQGAQRAPQGFRRPSTSDAIGPSNRQPPPVSAAHDGRNPGIAPTVAAAGVASVPPGARSTSGYRSPTPTRSDPSTSPQQASGGTFSSIPPAKYPPSKLPRAGSSASPAGPPPSGPTPAKPMAGEQVPLMRVRGTSADRAGPGSGYSQPTPASYTNAAVIPAAAAAAGVVAGNEAAPINGRRTPTSQAAQVAKQEPSAATDVGRGGQRGHRHLQGSVDSSAEMGARAMRPSSPPPPTRQPSNPTSRRSSVRNSQTVVLLKELDAARNRNAWYASELELARKSGYISAATMNPLDAKAAETFDDEDRPLIEALLAMRMELANVQSSVDKQAVLAAKQIAEAEKQRDAAIQEVVYAKAKLAAQTGGGSLASTPQLDSERDEPGERSHDLGRKLAMALHLQKDLKSQVEQLKNELAAERNARQLADDTTAAAQQRLTDLETYKQQTSTEVGRLKAELHLVQRDAREQSVMSAEAVAALELMKVERGEFEVKYKEAVGAFKNHDETFDSLRSAVNASQDARSHLEKKLEEERAARDTIEEELNKLRMEFDARTSELASSTQRLRDAEELAEKHANEARTHRHALLSGLDKLSTRELADAGKGDGERVLVLQKQIAASSELVKKYQHDANDAADKLRSAEERIAGLEQYQEQSSREGVAIRRQLQAALRETQSLMAGHTDLQRKLAAQQLETNAMTVQHHALKDILAERGISPTTAIRSRGLTSPRTNSPEQTRLRDLETQLAGATAAHEESRQQFEAQQRDSEMAYREKLEQLEADYLSVVCCFKSAEQTLQQLKDQITKYEKDNGRLKTENQELESQRDGLQARIEALMTETHSSGSQLEKNLESWKKDVAENKQQRDAAIKSLEQMQSENALLEQRAGDAEQKVALLLNQVEHSVDNYRRRSRQAPSMTSESTNGHALGGHTEAEVSENESEYDDMDGDDDDDGNDNGNGNGNGSSDNHPPKTAAPSKCKNKDNRNSAALDNLASELETLRSHWEATNMNYHHRLSTNFDFDTHAAVGGSSASASAGTSIGGNKKPVSSSEEEDHHLHQGGGGVSKNAAGLSESLADWRKKFDTESHDSGSGLGAGGESRDKT
ncbi:related to cell polarity protein tea1p [Claviceps purpurea 20.1]|uniref:Related to cell polarity protein tea1p n=1 Tax=Claviceps purpurea (strain 20.1) TaxID=1111077 RepID=M1W563_CLAP2|nr:related to cell polarity protein tea1p [Claviceps purpurea 20.1]